MRRPRQCAAPMASLREQQFHRALDKALEACLRGAKSEQVQRTLAEAPQEVRDQVHALQGALLQGVSDNIKVRPVLPLLWREGAP